MNGPFLNGPSIAQIKCLTAQAFGITEAELIGQQRGQDLVIPRHIAMYLSKRYTNSSLPMIGRQFGGRDHTTVLHAVRHIKLLLDEPQSSIAPMVEALEHEIGQGLMSLNLQAREIAEQVLSNAAKPPLVAALYLTPHQVVLLAQAVAEGALPAKPAPIFKINFVTKAPFKTHLVTEAAERLSTIAGDLPQAIFTKRERPVRRDFYNALSQLQAATSDYKKEFTHG